ncbi:hypothetical protein BGZ74_010157 [Mortierella antarctica]|nr:hypothetical protein BGZ74_010157 [Mortierella antarctica]
MDRTHPLNIPEILSLVGSFVPAWQEPPSGSKFAPLNLLSCALVNKAWREAMLPHLWAVYHHDSLVSAHVPTRLLFKYSPYFHFFQPPERVVKGLWRKDSAGQSLFQCTRLKFFLLSASNNFLPQLQLLYKNPGVESLHWHEFRPAKLPGRLVDLVQPFAGSIKYLHLEKGKYSEAKLVLLLNCFPRLRRLHISRRTQGHIDQPTLNLTGAQHGLQITELESLTIESFFDEDKYDTFMSILSRNPRIDHIDLNVLIPKHASVPTSVPDTLFHLCKQVLDQRDLEHSLQRQAKVLKDLRFRVTKSNLMISKCVIHFEIQGQYIVALSAILYKQDADILYPRLSAYIYVLNHLDVVCHDSSDIDVLRDVLRHFSALRHLRFISRNGLGNKDSNEVFQAPEDCRQNSRTSISIAGSTAGGSVWACQDSLEHLNLGGLWKTAKEHCERDCGFVAASQGYRWVACDNFSFGPTIRNVIMQRVQTLPHLRALTLQGVTFEYRQIDDSTTSVS